MENKEQEYTRNGTKRVSNKGRKVLLSTDVFNAIIASLRAGNYIETAAAYAGISKNTLFEWLKRGRREKRRLAKDKRLRPRSSEGQFVIFVDGVSRALAESEVRDTTMIAKAAAGGQAFTEIKEIKDANGNVVSTQITTKTLAPQWQAAAWRLERRYPKKWGRRVAIRKDEGNGEMSPEEYAKRVKGEFGCIEGMIGTGVESLESQVQEEPGNDQASEDN